ncbi:MAG: hypothetical protein V3R80_07400, partial [Candidatus Tectomicrobia bacterium]
AGVVGIPARHSPGHRATPAALPDERGARRIPPLRHDQDACNMPACLPPQPRTRRRGPARSRPQPRP